MRLRSKRGRTNLCPKSGTISGEKLRSLHTICGFINRYPRRSNMKHAYKMLLIAAGPLISASTSWADTLTTHRIPAALAVEATNETVAACARQGYRETAVVLDADGAIIVALRGAGAGIHTLDSAHDKAYTAVSFKKQYIGFGRARQGRGFDCATCQAAACHVFWWRRGDQAWRRGHRLHRCERRARR